MAKKHKSVRAAQEAGSLYFYDKNGVKKLAVTAEQLNAWKKKNKGKYKGSALAAWANNKGKDVGEKGSAKVRPKLRPKTNKAPKKKDAISDEQRSRQTTTPKRALNNSAMSPGQQVEKLQKDIAQAQKDRAAKREAIQKGRDEADKILADTGTGAGSGPSTRPNNRPKGPKAEVERRTQNKNKSPDELNTQSFDSVKRTDRKGVSLTREELKAMNEAYPRNKMNKGGMTKKGVMTYNMGGMVKSQTNNLKKGRS
tara:strand:- start:931 stop:1692 length:762 start_codon:yes stop_codon:yes gene_type:complete